MGTFNEDCAELNRACRKLFFVVGKDLMGYQPLSVEPYYLLDGTLCCDKCAGKITAYDVSCPHCGKRLTSGTPLKFGGYTSRDMLPAEREQGLPAGSTLVEGIEVLKQEYAFLNSLRRRMEEP